MGFEYSGNLVYTKFHIPHPKPAWFDGGQAD